jgi:hypothetical protein
MLGPSRRRFVLPLIYVALNLGLVLNAETSGEDATPNQSLPPELERIASAIGIWDTTTSYRSTPDASIFKGCGVHTIRLSTNGQFLISDEHNLSPDGWKNELVITTWNQFKKEYRLLHIDSAGDTVEASMVVQGNTRIVLFYSRYDSALLPSAGAFPICNRVPRRGKSRLESLSGRNAEICGGTAPRRELSFQSSKTIRESPSPQM